MASKTSAEKAQIKQDEILAAQLMKHNRVGWLEELVGLTWDPHNLLYDLELQEFTEVLLRISRFWLLAAEKANANPCKHGIQFGGYRPGEGLTITLRQVHALFPDKYQAYIQDDDRKPPAQDAAWLDENLINALVWLNSSQDEDNERVFGVGIASMIRVDVDDIYNNDKEIQKSFLEYLTDTINAGGPECEEAVPYKFPTHVKKIVWLFNYHKQHWTTMVTEIDDNKWQHHLYDSAQFAQELGNLGIDSKLLESLPKIQKIIQTVSGYPLPSSPFSESSVKLRPGPTQENESDCGVLAVWNIIEVLQGKEPDRNINPTFLRLAMLRCIAGVLRKMFPDDKGVDDIQSEDGDVHAGNRDGDVEMVDKYRGDKGTGDESNGYEGIVDEAFELASADEYMDRVEARLRGGVPESEGDVGAQDRNNDAGVDGKDMFGLDPDDDMYRSNAFEDWDEDDSSYVDNGDFDESMMDD